MNKASVRLRLMAAAAVLVALGACSSLIPPVPVTNLYGIDGVQVDLAHAGNGVGTSALGPAVTSFQGTFDAEFDAEGINLPGFISASLLQESITIGTSVQVTVIGENAVTELDGFEVVGAQVALAIFVDGTQIGTAGGMASFGSGLPVSRQNCTFNGFDTTCAYTATVDTAEHAVVVVASAASAKAVFDAMTAGETLEVRGSFAVTLAAPGLTSSAVVRVTLDTLDGSIKF